MQSILHRVNLFELNSRFFIFFFIFFAHNCDIYKLNQISMFTNSKLYETMK
jgi:hypothetical protein